MKADNTDAYLSIYCEKLRIAEIRQNIASSTKLSKRLSRAPHRHICDSLVIDYYRSFLKMKKMDTSDGDEAPQMMKSSPEALSYSFDSFATRLYYANITLR